MVREVSSYLEEQLGAAEEVGIAAITASELLHGVRVGTAGHFERIPGLDVLAITWRPEA